MSTIKSGLPAVLLVVLCCHAVCKATITSDSVQVFKNLQGGIAGSLINSVSWNNASNVAAVFNFNAEVLQRKKGTGWSSSLAAEWELGFTSYMDSVWVKHADAFRWQWLRLNNGNNGRQSFSFTGSTQLFDSWERFGFSGKEVKRLKGTFFLPAIIEGGYGFYKQIGDFCTLNLAVATVRITHFPKNKLDSGKQHLMTTEYGTVDISYGCSGQAIVYKQFNDRIFWYANGDFFFNGQGKDGMNLNVLNRCTFKVWKWFQVRCESRLRYDPLYLDRLQIRNELLFGIFIDYSTSFDRPSSLGRP